MLNGRFAGRKAVVLRTYDEGNKERKFGHALVAGIERGPRKLTKKMTAEQKEKRMRVKPFVKFANFQHIMPTRYNLDVSEALAKLVSDDKLVDEEKKAQVKKDIKSKLEERYKTIGDAKNEKVAAGVQYFFRCVARRTSLSAVLSRHPRQCEIAHTSFIVRLGMQEATVLNWFSSCYRVSRNDCFKGEMALARARRTLTCGSGRDCGNPRTR